jgi:hypothetical protein
VVPAQVVAPQVEEVLALVVGGRGWEGAAQAVVLVLVLALGVVLEWARGEGRAAVDSSGSSSSKHSRCIHRLLLVEAAAANLVR